MYNLWKHSWNKRICDYEVKEHTTILGKVIHMASFKIHLSKIIGLYEKKNTFDILAKRPHYLKEKYDHSVIRLFDSNTLCEITME